MSAYQFVPSPDLSTKEANYAFWENGFTPTELNAIEALGDSLITADALVDVDKIIPTIRKSKTSWISYNQDSAWLYDRLTYISRQLNGQYFDFDLYGFVEDFQYTVYHGGNSHYVWHMDKGTGTAPRKLSLVVQLSNPGEYEGGDLELMFANEPFRVKKQRGLLYAFPSWLLHRVTPVTKGVRKTLVVWISGTRFK